MQNLNHLCISVSITQKWRNSLPGAREWGGGDSYYQSVLVDISSSVVSVLSLRKWDEFHAIVLKIFKYQQYDI